MPKWRARSAWWTAWRTAGKASRKGLETQLRGEPSRSFLTSTTRFLRQFLQVAMLAAGAWLAIEQLATRRRHDRGDHHPRARAGAGRDR